MIFLWKWSKNGFANIKTIWKKTLAYNVRTFDAKFFFTGHSNTLIDCILSLLLLNLAYELRCRLKAYNNTNNKIYWQHTQTKQKLHANTIHMMFSILNWTFEQQNHPKNKNKKYAQPLFERHKYAKNQNKKK